MAEIQKTTQSGELTAQFIEFVMMTAQNASLFLGLTPNPHSGQPEVNLDLARLFIDQLAMIQEKTRGNLTEEEARILRNALGNLQMAFVEVSGGAPSPGGRAPGNSPAAAVPEPEPVQPAQTAAAAPTLAPEPPAEERESKKRFTKSYGG